MHKPKNAKSYIKTSRFVARLRCLVEVARVLPNLGDITVLKIYLLYLNQK